MQVSRTSTLRSASFVAAERSIAEQIVEYLKYKRVDAFEVVQRTSDTCEIVYSIRPWE